MSTNWQINTANTGAQMPGVASLLQNQSAPPLVGDAQYRGEPLAPADPNATSYSSVGMAPPPAVVAPPATTAPGYIGYNDWLKTQQQPDFAANYNPFLSNAVSPQAAQKEWEAQKAKEYQAAYGDKLTSKEFVPSFSDYWALQQASFKPEMVGDMPIETEGGMPSVQYTQFDPTAALKGYAEKGGKVSYADFLGTLPKPVGYGDPLSRAVSGAAGAESRAAQNWLSAYSPEFQKVGGWDSKTNPSGYLVSEVGGKLQTTRKRPDIGDRWFEYRVIKPDGSLGEPHIEYQPKSGGLGGFLKMVAPLALGAFAPGLGNLLGGGLMGNIGAGAIIGGGTSALTGGNVLKGAALGGLGAGVSSGIGSLTSGLDPAIVKAAQGAGSSLVRGAVTGNFDPTDILASAGTGYLSDSVRSTLADIFPTQNLYEQNIAPGIKPETSVAGFIENIGRNAAINAPGTLIRGGDLGDMLTNTAIGEAAKTATGYVPKTGDDFIDRLTGGATSALVSSGLRDIVTGDDKSPAAPKTVASADKETSPQAGSQEQVLSELMAMLGGGTSSGSQYFAPTNDYDLGRAFSAARATREAAARNRQMEMQIAALLGRGQA